MKDIVERLSEIIEEKQVEINNLVWEKIVLQNELKRVMKMLEGA
jgi:hypothetical protein